MLCFFMIGLYATENYVTHFVENYVTQFVDTSLSA